MRRKTLWGIWPFSFLVLSVLAPLQAYGEQPIPVTVSILPQKYFVEKIGAELVDVSVMVPPGAVAERYEPKPKQMVMLSGSRIYFAIGIPFEDAWLDKFKAANPKMLISHTEEGIEKRRMEAHSHGDEELSGTSHSQGEAEHGLRDPHVWLSPPLVMLQARNILDALLQVDPDHRSTYEQNYKAFIGDLAGLDLAIRNIFWGKAKPIRFLVFHPAWGYFSQAYGLQQIPVEVEGKEPKAQALEQLIKTAKADNIKTVFVQPQFSTRSAQTIADAIGARLVPADDLAADWAKNLLEVAAAIASQ